MIVFVEIIEIQLVQFPVEDPDLMGSVHFAGLLVGARGREDKLAAANDRRLVIGEGVIEASGHVGCATPTLLWFGGDSAMAAIEDQQGFRFVVLRQEILAQLLHLYAA